MSIVVLAEKPSVAEDIAKMLNINKKEATHWSGEGIVDMGCRPYARTEIHG